MPEVNLKFEVHIKKKYTSNDPDEKFLIEPRYRIYINSDLITERSWPWGEDIVLQESIWFTQSDTNHTLKLTTRIEWSPLLRSNLNLRYCYYSFSIKNLLIDEQTILHKTVVSNRGQDLEISFTI